MVHVNFHMPTLCDSLNSDIKQKAKCRFCVVGNFTFHAPPQEKVNEERNKTKTLTQITFLLRYVAIENFRKLY